jgi:hypothetical protein
MSKKYLIGTGIIVVAFAIFTGVAFVQSSEDVKTVNAGECPRSGDAGAMQASGVPGSCSEIHQQALAAGKMGQGEYTHAQAALASVLVSGDATPDQCREIFASLGHECSEEELLACAEKIQAMGYCQDMTAKECADGLALKLNATPDPATCAKIHATGAKCPNPCSLGMRAASGAEVTPGVATTETGTKAVSIKQCDVSKGSCAPATQTETKAASIKQCDISKGSCAPAKKSGDK